ncbi:hypothetical protein CRG98_010410, partial [Punica granatum]
PILLFSSTNNAYQSRDMLTAERTGAAILDLTDPSEKGGRATITLQSGQSVADSNCLMQQCIPQMYRSPVLLIVGWVFGVFLVVIVVFGTCSGNGTLAGRAGESLLFCSLSRCGWARRGRQPAQVGHCPEPLHIPKRYFFTTFDLLSSTGRRFRSQSGKEGARRSSIGTHRYVIATISCCLRERHPLETFANARNEVN